MCGNRWEGLDPNARIRPDNHTATAGPAQARARALFDGDGMKALMGSLVGERLDGPSLVHTTLFRVGDFLSLHNDAGEWRHLAFAWHLGRAWAEGDGGELAFVCGGGGGGGGGGGPRLIPPRFNQLTIFRTTGALGARAMHGVMPVIHAPGAGRIAISGWLTQMGQGGAAPSES